MTILNAWILTLLLVVPVVGALVLVFLNERRPGLLKGVALATACIEFLLSLPLFTAFQPGGAAVQFELRLAWIASLGASYHVGIDGVSLLLVLLTTFLTVLALLSSWGAVTKHLKGYLIAMLLLEASVVGVFVSLDVLLFYVFWEMTLIPMYLLIGVWGGERRIYAAVKFFLYTMAGSVLMMVAILALYFMNAGAGGGNTFSLAALASFARTLPYGTQLWLFLAFFVAFAIKVPIFPFHTWLPDAHTEAPTAGSVMLAGVLLKMGVYGLLRFAFPLFPQVVISAAPYISVLAVIGILYGALVALMQPDLKRLVAYSSVAHLGFVVLGVFALTAEGLAGGMLQMINHGLSTGALFLLVGMVYERRHTREIAQFGGLWKVMPAFAVLYLIVTFSSIGLPGTNGFVGEFLILLGAFRSQVVFGVLGTAGIVLGAVYMLWTYQRVFFGAVDKPANLALKDLNVRELVTMAPLVILILAIGWYPAPLLARLEPAVQALMALFR
ncbi:MAG TPA: NADH-quinone oxidoreductase subunit M [Anaerolineae bacterium]|nr:NADH-quinone oxidoreductase subunit M [Anaerolineae bacterium]HOQ98390.1 NADH-quinone oxidoreductase subunit M [Anaerolineae bacterium]HPL26498.1 NADH-quinone oxidoreductase subunit M [Anaerolineae bacterium]